MTLERFAIVLNTINLAVQEEVAVPAIIRGTKLRERVVRLAVHYGRDKQPRITQPEVSHVLAYSLGTFLDRLPEREKEHE